VSLAESQTPPNASETQNTSQKRILLEHSTTAPEIRQDLLSDALLVPSKFRVTIFTRK
jgi:hypothetical protein